MKNNTYYFSHDYKSPIARFDARYAEGHQLDPTDMNRTIGELNKLKFA